MNCNISKKAKIANNVIIGDYSTIKDDVEISENVIIGSNVLIDNGARISKGVKIFNGAVISSIPQDLKFKGEESIVEIGENTTIREFATVNRGTAYSGKTVIGKNCLIMAYSHVAHDCILKDNVILANVSQLAGHVLIDDYAILGGLSGVHQFVKIGKHSIMATHSRVTKDIPPFITAGNYPLRYEGLNSTGLKRRGFTTEEINLIKSVYDILYSPKFNTSDALKKIKDEFENTGYVKEIIDFVETSERGIIGANN